MAAGDLGRTSVVDVAQRASSSQAAERVDRQAHPADSSDAGQGRAEDEPRDAADVRRAAEDFNQAFTLFDIQAKFSIHEATGSIIVDVIDTRTGDVIREIPPRELLDRWAQMMDIMGLFVDGRA